MRVVLDTAYPRVRKRLHYTDEQLDQAVALVEHNATVIANPPDVRVVPDDPDDGKFVAVALAGNAEYLVTGDEHVLQVGQHQGITILKPGDFLAFWRNRQHEGSAPEGPSEENGVK